MTKSKKDKKPAMKGRKGAESFDQLIDQANEAMANMHLELAKQLYDKALSKRPNDTNTMDALADVCLQLNESEQAKSLLLQSTVLAPTENPFKWLFLGQLCSGGEAVATYNTAISVLHNALIQETDDDNARQLMRKQIAKAHCSIAEIFLTDLCFEEHAESNCELAITQALQLEPGSLDVRQTLASLRISQSRKEEACSLIAGVFADLTRIRKVVSSRSVVDEIRGVELAMEFQDMPEFDFCIATAKLLVECSSQEPTLAENAADLVSDLLQEDDENIELWYLMGVSALSCRPPDASAARFNFMRALDMISTLRESNGLTADVAEANSIDLPYEEEHQLIMDHLAIIDEHEQRQGTEGQDDTRKLTDATQQRADEEWSTCDEDENDGMQCEDS